ncbi:hypothetical protein LGT39_06160 [Demequina sp. TTPB684]|uniref:hypothetical protein n=1 Tax=unclassified Demequina TaxID=2620311 RepID=UPI001CF0F82D|nr:MULTISPECIES: hypothetical protein [unclassified Demequina]MCB2412432.1 hypothetical protein [Demequina sp. TTPB684]UPU87412.1 hypothetical protein LGT36_009040 [Demequina sp. TMPB413]
MPPAGLLAIIAVGLVLAYVLPQRIRERSDYALVRTEDRYSADMRVVRATAARVAPIDAASASSEVPLLVTGAARVRVASVSESHMSRPHGPLDRAATHAQRESNAMRRDRLGSIAQRAARARRRAFFSALATLVTLAAWVVAVTTAMPALIAGVATGVMVTTIGTSARAGAAERKALAQIRAVDREVRAAATATRALRVVAAARANGQDVQPSEVATQAIRIITATDLAPLKAPAISTPRRAVAAQQASVPADASARGEATESRNAAWRPKTMPVPAYALKASVRQQAARQLSEDDYAASSHASHKASQAETRAEQTARDVPVTGALDAILAKRRQASA